MTTKTLSEKIKELKQEMKGKGYSNKEIFYIIKMIEQMDKEFIKKLKYYLDCDWKGFSKDAQQLVKDFIEEIDKLAGEKLT